VGVAIAASPPYLLFVFTNALLTSVTATVRTLSSNSSSI